MGIIEDFEHQYAIISAEITNKLQKLSLTKDDKDFHRSLVIDINSKFGDATEVLEQMELEISQNENKAQKSSQLNRFKSFQSELRRLEDEYKKIKIKPNSEFNLDDESEDEFEISVDQKQKLLDNSARLERTGFALKDAQKISIETEEIGNSILQNLSQQRETITSARRNIREANADLGLSSRVINSMLNRSIRDKLLLYIIAVVFVVAICVTIYFSI